MSSLTCLSLFSGAGGLDLGFRDAGFRIVLGVDTDPLAASSHRANFSGVPFFEGSVLDLTRERAADLTGEGSLTDLDMLIGGPPCPPYSKSRFYRKDKPRALEDPKGWEGVEGYLQALRSFSPRAFLLENVPGLAYSIHREALDRIIGGAGDAGYRVYEPRILNAADYGVPQIRQRLFIVGVRHDHHGDFEWPVQTHEERATPTLFSGSLQPWRTSGEAIGDLDTEENADDTGHFAGGKYHHLLREIPPGDNYLYFTEHRGHPEPQFRWRSRYWSFLLKLSPDLPSWTIQARRSNNMGPFHWRNRILRIEEIKRLQTFPDDWELHGTTEQQWRQVGNAVPPLLAKRLGETLASTLADEATQTRAAS